MALDFKKLISSLADGEILSRDMARDAFKYMMNGTALLIILLKHLIQ